MKKIISILLVTMLLITVIVGCASDPVDDPADEPGTDVTEGADVTEGKIVKFGLGNMVSIESSVEAKDEKMAKAQADITAAAVGFDADGKVQSVTIDVSQPQVEFDNDLKITSDRDEEVKSKHELKEDYGMKKASAIEKEWYEQMNSLQEWMIGKTVDEIIGMQTKKVDEGDPQVPDVEELTSSVTIDVGGYLAVVQDAWDNAVDVEGAEKVGLGFKTMLDSSKDMVDDKNALAQADATMSATAFDTDGKVVKTVIDVVQVKVEYDAEGKLVTDKDGEIKTKHELKEDYGMKKVSPIEKEWYEQMNSFQEWMQGKTVDEIVGMQTKKVDETHPQVPDVEELTSSVTINVESYLDVVKEASENAK